MAQVLHFNMHRIYDLWGIFLSHVLEVLASPKVSSTATVMLCSRMAMAARGHSNLQKQAALV